MNSASSPAIGSILDRGLRRTHQACRAKELGPRLCERCVKPDGYAEVAVEIESRGEDEIVGQTRRELSGQEPDRLVESHCDFWPGVKIGPARVGLAEVQDE